MEVLSRLCPARSGTGEGGERRPNMSLLLSAEWVCAGWGWGEGSTAFKAPSPGVAPAASFSGLENQSNVSPAQDVDLSEQGSLAGVAKANPAPSPHAAQRRWLHRVWVLTRASGQGSGVPPSIRCASGSLGWRLSALLGWGKGCQTSHSLPREA